MEIDLTYTMSLDVRGLLTRDAICRNLRQWPLLPTGQMEGIWRLTASFRRARSTTQRALDGLRRDFLTAAAVFVLEVQRDAGKSWSATESEALRLLGTDFPLSLDLLKHFEGKIVAAGGAIFKTLHENTADDIDFFFVDPDVEKLDSRTASEKSTDLLAEAIAFLTDKWLHEGRAPPGRWDDAPFVPNVYVLRSEFVTTVHLVSSSNQDYKLQFIHRVYPNVEAILGGFDLGPAMVATDGRRILATELGAWSALGKTLIVDTSRRSTSFEHRLKKYSGYCHIVLPGLPGDLATKMIPKKHDPNTLMRELAAYVRRSGFRIESDPFRSPQRTPYNSARIVVGSVHFVNDRDDLQSEEEVMDRLTSKAAALGYRIEELKLVPIRQTCNAADLREELRQLASSEGYELNTHLMAACIRLEEEWGDFYPPEKYRELVENHDDGKVLKPHNTFLQLPVARINLRTYMSDFQSSGYTWTISGIGRTTIESKSDYSDNKMWPSNCTESNVTMMAAGKLSAVVVPLVLKKPGDPLVTPYNDQPGEGLWNHNRTDVTNMRSLKSLTNCAVDVARGEAKEAVLTSFIMPQMGDWLPAVQHRYVLNSTSFCGMMNLGREPVVISGDEECPYKDDLDSITKECAERFQKVCSSLIGVRWTLRNPGRQWTSSHNPIMANPREWYGEHYRSFRLGCEAVETCLRLCRRRDGLLHRLPRDIFARIVREVVWENSLLE